MKLNARCALPVYPVLKDQSLKNVSTHLKKNTSPQYNSNSLNCKKPRAPQYSSAQLTAVKNEEKILFSTELFSSDAWMTFRHTFSNWRYLNKKWNQHKPESTSMSYLIKTVFQSEWFKKLFPSICNVNLEKLFLKNVFWIDLSSTEFISENIGQRIFENTQI